MGRFEKWGGWGVAVVVGLIAYGWSNSAKEEIETYQVIADRLEASRKATVQTAHSLTMELKEVRQELEKAREQLAALAAGGDAAPEAEEADGGNEVAAMLQNMDTDGDGKIQESEAPEQMKQFFGAIDSNGDGGLDAAELEVMMEYRRQRGL